MKYVVCLILLFMSLVVVTTLRKTNQEPQKILTDSISSTRSIPHPNDEVTLQGHTYEIYWQKIDPKGLTLIPNFSEKKTSSQLMEDAACLYGVNGGFYTPDNTPIGLFISQRGTLSQASTNQTLNGFFVKTQTGQLSITRTPPVNPVSFALQSGPYIKPTVPLQMASDSFDRRILVARTDSNVWYFIAITAKDNSFSGPNLSDVPKILENLPIPIIEALNLDGGSASAFYSDKGIRLGELTPVGSFFCGSK